jgi:pseudouridine kinase
MEDFSQFPDQPVLVIGAAGMDIVGRLRDELHPGSSTPAHIRTSCGGVSRNVAENLARLGQPVRLLTVVGDDQAGEQLLQNTAAAGVDVRAALRTPEHPTGTYLAVIDAAGRKQYGLDDMRAISALTAAYVREQEDLFYEASLLFVDANLPKETMRAAMALARKARLPVCADPTSQILAERIRPYLPRLSLVRPNNAEAAVLCEHDFNAASRREALAAANQIVAQGAGIVIITMAEFGVCYATAETNGHIPAMRTALIDPTGAGDALTATVIFALLNEIPLDDAVRLGVAAASLTLRHKGAVVPDLSLEKLYDQL